MKIITAVYDKLHGTKFGGRLNRDRHYIYSLKTLLGMGVQFICYTSINSIDWLRKELKGFSNIEFRLFELEDYRHHQTIQKIKNDNRDRYAQDNVWEFRCVELMWLKMEWLKQEAERTNEKVFWIDAGISHAGILPKRFNKNKVEKLKYEQEFDNIYAFNKGFLNKLDGLSENFFAFYCNNRQHMHARKFAYDSNNLPGSIVAGVLGGSKESIDKVYDEFSKVIQIVMDDNDLTQEEMALTIVYRDHPELFSVVDFDTWYHEDWECFNPDLKSFCSFFEDLENW